MIENLPHILSDYARKKLFNFLGIEQRGFEGAKVGRLTGDWISTIRSINADIREGQMRLVARGRNAAQNEPYARKFLRSLTKHGVGPSGFTLRVKSFDWKKESGKENKVFNKELNRAVQEAFKTWCKKENCTFSGDISFRESCKLILQTIARDGEIFLIKHRSKVNKFHYTLQAVETEYVDVNYFKSNLPNGNYIFMGIEFTKQRKPVRYYFRKSKPENEQFNYLSQEYTAIDAENVTHLYVKESFYQVRGITWFAPVLVRMHMLNSYQEAQLTKARAVAATTGVLEPKDDSSGPNIGNFIVGGQKDSDNNTVKPIQPLEPFILPKGYNFREFDPKAPTGLEGAFAKQVLMDTASGLDISYINLASNYESVNYTSSRTALLDERDTWKDLHSWFIEHFLNELYEDWLENALFAKAVEGATWQQYDYLKKYVWTGRTWQWVDPKKEIEAISKAVDQKLLTFEEALAMQGKDLDEHMDQLEYEDQELSNRGLRIKKEKDNASTN